MLKNSHRPAAAGAMGLVTGRSRGDVIQQVRRQRTLIAGASRTVNVLGSEPGRDTKQAPGGASISRASTDRCAGWDSKRGDPLDDGSHCSSGVSLASSLRLGASPSDGAHNNESAPSHAKTIPKAGSTAVGKILSNQDVDVRS
jgi:hypothetical protein